MGLCVCMGIGPPELDFVGNSVFLSRYRTAQIFFCFFFFFSPLIQRWVFFFFFILCDTGTVSGVFWLHKILLFEQGCHYLPLLLGQEELLPQSTQKEIFNLSVPS